MTKKIYIVDHFVPFPQSEYGGQWVVVAENDESCFDIITEDDDENYPEFYGNLRENILKSYKYSVTDEVETGIVTSFLT